MKNYIKGEGLTAYLKRTDPGPNWPPKKKLTLEDVKKALKKAEDDYWKNNSKHHAWVGVAWMLSLSDEHFLLLCGDSSITVLTGSEGLKRMEERLAKLTNT